MSEMSSPSSVTHKLAEPGSGLINSPFAILPAWLLDSCELSLRWRSESVSHRFAYPLKVLPPVSSEVLGFWAMMVVACQKSIAAGDSAKSNSLSLRFSECVRCFGGDDQAAAGNLKQAFESFGAIRIVRMQDGRALPLFGDDVSLTCEGDDFILRLGLKPWTTETLFGLADGHSEAKRVLAGEVTATSILGSSPPLTIFKPLWLESESYQRQLYCRLEKAMQWNPTLLHLEGVYGLTFSELFDGLIPGFGESDRAGLMLRLREIGLLGRRLLEHGVVVREPNTSFYASSFPKHSDTPMLLWQTAQEALRLQAEVALIGAAFEERRRSEHIEASLALWRNIAPGVGQMGLDLKKLYLMTFDIPGGVFRASETTVLQAHNLFFEFALRRPQLSKIPLPEELRSQELFAVCRLQGDVVRDFRRFMDLAANSEAFARLIKTDCLMTIGLTHLDSEATLAKRLLDQSILTSAQQSRVENNQKSESLTNVNSLSNPKNEDDSGRAPVAESSTRLLSLAESKMMRIAHDELERMVKSDQNAYEMLKSRYLKSLEENQRSLVLDFQRRLKPKVFEEQIKQRLVRYMVSHPSDWKSSRTPLQ